MIIKNIVELRGKEYYFDPDGGLTELLKINKSKYTIKNTSKITFTTDNAGIISKYISSLDIRLCSRYNYVTEFLLVDRETFENKSVICLPSEKVNFIHVFDSVDIDKELSKIRHYLEGCYIDLIDNEFCIFGKISGLFIDNN